MIYNRILHTDDYSVLSKWIGPLQIFEAYLARLGAPYRKDHQHREWEYGSILQQLEELGIPKSAKILDTGSGASYFPPFLVYHGWTGVVVSDSMDYGDITDWLIRQSIALGIEIPVLKAPVENLGGYSDYWDVTMCISTIEHLDPKNYEKGLQELYRVTKPGGYIFITSDFFESEERAQQSPFIGIQHTRFTPSNLPRKLLDSIPNAKLVGVMDFTYRGDFVNNYSFVNFCLQKP